MPKIKIHRVSQFENRGRKIKLEIDGEFVGSIKNGESLIFEVNPGKHLVQAKIDWCSSNLIELNASDNSEFEYELKKGRGPAIYRIIFNSGEYLSLSPIS